MASSVGAGLGVPSFDPSYKNWDLSRLLKRVGPEKNEEELFDAIITQYMTKDTASKEQIRDGIRADINDFINPHKEALKRLLVEIELADAGGGAGLEGLGVLPSSPRREEGPRQSKPREASAQALTQKAAEKEVVRHPLPTPGSVVTQRQVPTEEELFPTLTQALHQESLLKAFATMKEFEEPSPYAVMECFKDKGLQEFFFKGDTLKNLYIDLRARDTWLERSRERVPRGVPPEEELAIAIKVADELYGKYMETGNKSENTGQLAKTVFLQLYEAHKSALLDTAKPDAARTLEPETIKGAISSALEQANQAVTYRTQAKKQVGRPKRRAEAEADKFAREALKMTKALWSEVALGQLSKATGLSEHQLEKLKAQFQKLKDPTEQDAQRVLNQLKQSG